MIKTVIISSLKQDRDKLAGILSVNADIKVLAYGKDAYDALKLIGKLKPDIVILDNNLEYIDGEEIPPLLKARSPSTAVVILISRISDYSLIKAASNEILGLVNKKTDMPLFPQIIRCIYDGGCYISPYLATRVLQLLADKNRHVKPDRSLPAGAYDDPTKYLSKTELQILTHIGDGLTSGEIAVRMNLAVGTIRNYISSVMRKTGLNNRSQMTRYAFLHGLVTFGRVENTK